MDIGIRVMNLDLNFLHDDNGNGVPDHNHYSIPSNGGCLKTRNIIYYKSLLYKGNMEIAKKYCTDKIL